MPNTLRTNSYTCSGGSVFFCVSGVRTLLTLQQMTQTVRDIWLNHSLFPLIRTHRVKCRGIGLPRPFLPGIGSRCVRVGAMTCTNVKVRITRSVLQTASVALCVKDRAGVRPGPQPKPELTDFGLHPYSPSLPF